MPKISNKKAADVQARHAEMRLVIERCHADKSAMAYYAAQGILLRTGEYTAYLTEKAKTCTGADKELINLWLDELKPIRERAKQYFLTSPRGRTK